MRNLNQAQCEAVEHLDGPALVLAGAGSGKTRVVVERICTLISKGVDPSKILAVTFTNKAAGEMRERIGQRAPIAPVTATFHSLCAKILRESIGTLDYSTSFVIYDDGDSLQLISEILKERSGKSEKKEARKLAAKISGVKGEMISCDEYNAPYGDQKEHEFKEIYTEYQRRLKNYNALDFDDLLFLTVKLLKETEEGMKWQRRWEYILVDEYQDTNYTQYLLCKLLSKQHGNLFVVGDPDQSIYSWRGADIGNILRFEEDFKGAKVIPLEQNYRSTNHFLKGANGLIAQNERPYTKELWSELGEGEKIGLHRFGNERQEVTFVVNQVKEYLQTISPEEIVIFFRTNSQSRTIEDGLMRANIPYVFVGGLSYYQRREVKDLLAYMRCVCFPDDYVSFSRVINKPKRGVGKTTLEKIKTFADGAGLSIIGGCRALIRGEGFKLTRNAAQGVLGFLGFIDHIAKLIELEEPLHHIIQQAIEKSGYMEFLKEDEESYQERKENIEELIGKAMTFESGSLQQFLEELSLKSAADDAGESFEKIRLMTLHNSKGLEFDACFIMGMEEDLFPHVNCKEDPSQLQEERRLCYVGITRAKKHLHLTTCQVRFLWGHQKHMIPSRFLSEIPSEHIDCGESVENSSDSFKVGDIVYHKEFGRGLIEKVSESSFGLTYDVRFFEDESSRSLVAKYAKLMKA